MITPLQIALVGAGSISRAHTKGFPLLSERVTLSAISSRNAQNASALAEEFGSGVKIFTDHRELLASAKPDGVILTLPHFLHHPVARDFLEAGVPVLVEKPITCTAAELRDLHSISIRKGVVLLAGQMRRYGKPVRTVKAWSDASPHHFGELRSFDVVVQVNIDAYTGGNDNHWALDGEKAGGGVIANFGIHRLDLVRHLGGADYAEVTALGRFDRPFFNNAESQASVLFRMSNGASGTLHTNALSPRTPFMDGFCMHGTCGTIVEVGGPLLYATTTGTVTREWGDQHQGFVEARVSSDPYDDAFVQQLLAFADAIQSVTSPRFNTADENFNTIACIDAIAESLRTGTTVKVVSL